MQDERLHGYKYRSVLVNIKLLLSWQKTQTWTLFSAKNKHNWKFQLKLVEEINLALIWINNPESQMNPPSSDLILTHIATH